MILHVIAYWLEVCRPAYLLSTEPLEFKLAVKLGCNFNRFVSFYINTVEKNKIQY